MTFAKLTAALVLAAGVGLAAAAQERTIPPTNDPTPPRPAAKRPPLAQKGQAPAAKAELEGTWRVTWIETAGAAVFDAKNHDETLPPPTFAFSGDRCEVTGVRVLNLANFRYRTNPTTAPKEIDATMLDGPKKGETVVGIYLVRGDELRICLRLQRPDLGRPKGYVTNSGTTLHTFFLTRGAKAGAAPQPKGVGIYDRIHMTADLPIPGTQMTSPKDRQRVYYHSNTLRMWGEPRNAGKHPGLYSSKDAGKSWKLVNTSFEFKTLFVHPTTGDLFAAIEHSWVGTDGKDRPLTRFHADKAVRSTDGGAKWQDITPPPGHLAHVTSFFADPDHPGRACFVTNVVRDVIYRPTDDRYSEYATIRAASVEGVRLMVRAGALGEER